MYEEVSAPLQYTHSLPSPEDFFIRQFNGDLNLTSKELRLEEAILESQLISLPEPEYKHRVQNFTRIRDYLALCRGESLVMIDISLYVYLILHLYLTS